MTALVALLRTIFGSDFPSGILVALSILLLGRPGVDVKPGVMALGLAIGWTYWSAAVQAYGSRDGRPVITAARTFVLLASWLGVCGACYLLYA